MSLFDAGNTAVAVTDRRPANEDEFLIPENDLSQTLDQIESIVPPLWPLKDYVAVNPFLGLSDHKFLAARQQLREVRDCELLPTIEYFQKQYATGQFLRADIVAALDECRDEYPDLLAGIDLSWIMSHLDSQPSLPVVERRFFTIAEIIDRQQHSSWNSHIVNDITRHCAAHYDEGQAIWPNPWQDLPLYQAWREASLLSRRMDYLGIQGFQNVVKQLPIQAEQAIGWMLTKLGVPRSQWRQFLLAQLFSISGWASFIKYRVRQAAMAGSRDEDLVGLLAIRLAYDLALSHMPLPPGAAATSSILADAMPDEADTAEALVPPANALTRYVLQVAVEHAYRRNVLGMLMAPRVPERSPRRKSAQMIFCIDVRSEIFRRHLESLDETLETFGFAGFFGMALEFVPLGQTSGVAQCPVLLSPGFRVPETVGKSTASQRESKMLAIREGRLGRKIWKSFQSSAISCFSFVESLGLLYFAKLLTDSWRLTRPVANSDRNGLLTQGAPDLGPLLRLCEDECLSLAKKADLAEGMLRNLGLTQGFARIVTICGHAADVLNNPYKAGLDCGACGGHSGEPNARVAAGILNDRDVRVALASRGIEIPEDTWFLAAVHNTTTDQIRLFDTEARLTTHRQDLVQLQRWLEDAGRLCRTERSQRLKDCTATDVFRRARDWAEVRPEWGLAGNAAFIVAPRSRTWGLNFGGRTFLHSYNQHQDLDRNVLELIMTAPMIVANWINLQYYASSVDNRSFGSGNKVIHNVVGQLGILAGNGGDLMTGLPWQSVHDGERFQHEPLRLLVVIEASRSAVEQIIAKHTLVRDLASNGWLSLVVLDGEHCYRWRSNGAWQVEPLPAPARG